MKLHFKFLLLCGIAISGYAFHIGYIEKPKRKPTSAVTEFLNGAKVHYRELDSSGLELVHFYFREENETIKTIFEYDSLGQKISEKIFLNDTLQHDVKYLYLYDQVSRPVKISKIKDSDTSVQIIRYQLKQGDLIETIYIGEENFTQGVWFKEICTRKGVAIGVKFSPEYGGGKNGEQLFKHFDKSGSIDYMVHLLGRSTDTTFYTYDQNGNMIHSSRIDGEYRDFSDTEYDSKGRRTKMTLKNIDPYSLDSMSYWTYDWKDFE